MRKNTRTNDSGLLGDDAVLDIINDIIDVNYQNRTIIFNEGVTDEAIELLCMTILNWNKEDKGKDSSSRKPIKIVMNSGGGDVLTGRAVLDAITLSKTPVWTIGIGQICSMATYMIAAGHVRYSFPKTVFLVHDGSTFVGGTNNKAKDHMKFYNRLDEDSTAFYIEHTNMDADFLEEIKDREYYMFAEEAKERGLIDKIIGIDCDIDEILA